MVTVESFDVSPFLFQRSKSFFGRTGDGAEEAGSWV